MFHWVELLATLVASIVVYFLPAIWAERRHRPDVAWLALFNVLLGWTVIGWLAAMYWALHPHNPRRTRVILVRSQRARGAKTADAITQRARWRMSRMPAPVPIHLDRGVESLSRYNSESRCER
jgi:hypothetical protein